MLKQQKIFFDFLRFCIGSDSEIPSSLKEADWKELYAIAKKQCLVGVLFDGIRRLPSSDVGISREMRCCIPMACIVRLVILISGWKGATNGLSLLFALSRLMKRRAITT